MEKQGPAKALPRSSNPGTLPSLSSSTPQRPRALLRYCSVAVPPPPSLRTEVPDAGGRAAFPVLPYMGMEGEAQTAGLPGQARGPNQEDGGGGGGWREGGARGEGGKERLFVPNATFLPFGVRLFADGGGKGSCLLWETRRRARAKSPGWLARGRRDSRCCIDVWRGV